MGIEEGIIAEAPTKDISPSTQRQQRQGFVRRYYPLWLCLLLALLMRAWLVFHTHGVIDGDEAMVGIQALHILHGDLPVYYIAQAYMGSLEAYLMAIVFAIGGPSVWTLRAEPIVVSLVLVWLTWKLAAILTDAAKLPDYAKRRFMIVATLFAALPPLYDTVIELRTLGGYIEAFVLMLLLLISAFRLPQRWHEGASIRELALRWAGIGLLVGIGFWVNPLIVSAILAAALWIVGYCIVELMKRRGKTGAGRPQGSSLQHSKYAGSRQIIVETTLAVIRPPALSSFALTALAALPAALVGFAPALYWGANNGWRNITYITNNGGGLSSQRLTTINNVAHLYTSCIARRIIDGALPDVAITATMPRLFTLALAIGACYLLASTLLFAISLFWHHPLLLQMRQLISLPLLFGICTAIVFCVSKISAVGLLINCNIVDYAGRYATPLLLALPFLFAASVTFFSMCLHQKEEQLQDANDEQKNSQPQSTSAASNSHPGLFRPLQAGLFALVLLILFAQGLTYAQTNAGYTFQTSGCVVAPANNDPIIAYMQRQHIHYAWAAFWIGNPIIFKTKESIIITDPRIITAPHIFKSRIPAYTNSVLHADRPSVLTLVPHGDTHPQLLRQLDIQHITYQVARFPSEPGVDLLIITPLNHNISPFDSNSLGAYFDGC